MAEKFAALQSRWPRLREDRLALASSSRALSRKYGGEQMRVLVTDEEMAKLVGRILYAANKGSASIADAHVVAACLSAEVAVVVTSDPGDINELASVVPGVKIMPRTP